MIGSPNRARRPDVRTAMTRLLAQGRALVSAVAAARLVCTGDCRDCMVKRLDVFEQDLADWDFRVGQGEVPKLGDLHRLARLGREVAADLAREGLLEPSHARSIAPTQRPW